MTPEDLEQIRAIAREESAAAEARIVDRLTETLDFSEWAILDRLAAIESRVLNLETRPPKP